MPYYPPASTGGGGSSTPETVTAGTTMTISTNTQVVHATPILTEAGGIVLTEGTGQIIGVFK